MVGSLGMSTSARGVRPTSAHTTRASSLAAAAVRNSVHQGACVRASARRESDGRQRAKEGPFDATGSCAVVDGRDHCVRVGGSYDERFVQPTLDSELRWAERALDEGDSFFGEEIEGVA